MRKLFIALLFFLFNRVTYGQELLSIGHRFKPKSGLEEITASIYSQMADTVHFTFYCEPDSGRIEYHEFPIINKRATTTSGIFCPRKVVVKAETKYSIQYDTLNVALIRKINDRKNEQGDNQYQQALRN